MRDYEEQTDWEKEQSVGIGRLTSEELELFINAIQEERNELAQLAKLVTVEAAKRYLH